MNRQERRRLGIKKKDPMVSLKQSDIDRMKEEATEKDASWHSTSCLPFRPWSFTTNMAF